MTSIAFIMGVVPLAFSVGAGAEMRQAMGIAVFAGMIGVTAFGIFLTPVFYVLLRKLTGNRPLRHHGEVPRDRGGGGAAEAVACRTDQEGLVNDGSKQLRHAERALLDCWMRSLFLAACATSLPEIPPTSCREPPPPSSRRSGRSPRPPRRSRAASGGRRSTTRSSTSWSSAPTGQLQRARRRGAPRAGARLGARRPTPIARRRSASARAPARAQGIVGGDAGPARNLFTAGADFSYEVDLFGRLSHATEAAKLDAQAQEGLLQSARLLVQAERGADLPRAARARQRARAGAEHPESRTAKRWRSPSAAGAPATSPSSTWRARAPRCPRPSPRRSRSTGAAPSSRTRSPCWWARSPSKFALQDAEWNTALPADSRRRAEHGAHAPARRVGGAEHACSRRSRASAWPRRRWFPNVALTGFGGYASTDLDDLLRVVVARLADRRAGLAADLRRRAAQGRHREHRAPSSTARWRNTASRCWSRSRTSRTSSPRCACSPSRPRRRRARSPRRAAPPSLSGARYRAGYVSQLELLDAQRSELRNRREALQVRSARYQSNRGAGPRARWRLGLITFSCNESPPAPKQARYARARNMAACLASLPSSCSSSAPAPGRRMRNGSRSSAAAVESQDTDVVRLGYRMPLRESERLVEADARAVRRERLAGAGHPRHDAPLRPQRDLDLAQREIAGATGKPASAATCCRRPSTTRTRACPRRSSSARTSASA